jgi:hypothetical protein
VLPLELVAFATLLRSVAFDRWITVLVSLLVLTGALGIRRGRSWGVALAFAAACFFPAAFLLGMAPGWFVAVGAIAAAPFLLTWRAFARSDRQATMWLVGLSASAGALIAVVWNLIAWPLFWSFPSLFPSFRPQHGLLVSALLAIGAGVGIARWRAARRAAASPPAIASTGVRIAAPVRVASSETDFSAAEWEAEEAMRGARAARSNLVKPRSG